MAKGSEAHRLPWARLNSYGLLLVGLLVLSIGNLLNPESSTIAQATGSIPDVQPYWELGFIFSGLLLLWGFVRATIWPEFLGLVVLQVALTIRTIHLVDVFGAGGGETVEAYLVWLVVFVTAVLRCSVILSPHGWVIHISGRKESE